MERKQLIKKFFDRSSSLNLKSKQYRSYIKNLFDSQLDEDIAKGDITTRALINKSKKIKAHIVAKQAGILAGIEESQLLTKNERINLLKTDGSNAKKGEVILEIIGNARRIMGYERTLVNILQRMSGIATLSYDTTKLVKGRCYIAATRKTLPHLIDKKAVAIGGALTHRLNLNDFILIKDNHLAMMGGNIRRALELAGKSKTKYIEIEVKNGEEAIQAAEAISRLKNEKMFAILFDNMAPAAIKNSLNHIKNDFNKKMILFEASGSIGPANIKDYSKSGADIVSLGFLTHSAKVFDMSLEVIG